MKKLLSLVLAIAMLLSMAATASAAEITNLNSYVTSNQEMAIFNIFYSQSLTDLDPLSNCLDSLLTNDNHSVLTGCAAKEWYTTDNGKSWTFVLNDGMTWYDYTGAVKADVVAEDWLWGLEWVLNFAKNEAVNTSMPIEMIEGAAEYYEYTKNLDTETAMGLGLEKFKEMVGVSTPDDKTIVYTCKTELAYFPTLATYCCLYPLSGKLLEEIGADGYKAVTYDTLWYNGPYTITSFVENNEKVFTAAPNYWNAANVKRFDTVTVKCVESDDMAYQLFQTGEIDHVKLTESNLHSLYNNEGSEFHNNLVVGRPDKYSYFMVLNLDKYLPDGTPDVNWNTAINNANFRKALMYGLDWTPYLSRYNAIDPLSCQNFTYTTRGVAAMSDGRDYVDLVLENLGLTYSNETYNRYQPEIAKQYKDKAIEELTALGVTFPVQLDYYVKGDNQTQHDTIAVLSQMIADNLGNDFIKVNVETYVSSSTKEVVNPKLGSMLAPAWGADYGDPLNFLTQMVTGNDNAFFAPYSNCNDVTNEETKAFFDKFTAVVKEAEAIADNTDARYTKFAEAEAMLLSEAYVIPTYLDVTWHLTCINDYSKIYAAYGNQSGRYVNWETNSDIYTTAEYAELKAAFEAAAQAE
ncbi:MAG: hypothetical protein J6K73_02255 [Clostridia bacterium]|nr:hypothetical protein [Clostridia bacterium]